MQQTFRLDSVLLAKILGSFVLVLALWLLRLLGTYAVRRCNNDVQVHYRWRKTSTYVAGILGVSVLGWLWFEQLRSMSTFLGLVSAGLVIALQEPLTNLAGWFFITWRRPFVMGDRIQIGEHAGDVVDVRLFQFSLIEIGNWVAADQSTGRLAHVPNRRVFTDVLINYGRGFEYIWNEVPVRITFESDWKKAKALLQAIADRHAAHLGEEARDRVRRAARRYMIVYSTLTPTVYTRVETYGVLLTIRYLCAPRRRRSSEAAIWEDVLQAFSEHAEIEFAYPTQRFFDRRAER
jgi:small-conductance mechanosensitive channel